MNPPKKDQALYLKRKIRFMSLNTGNETSELFIPKYALSTFGKSFNPRCIPAFCGMPACLHRHHRGNLVKCELRTSLQKKSVE